MLLRMTTALILAAGISGAALAEDRAPTAEEKTAIEAALQAAGYSYWEEIELDDGVWEVDDAVHSDGKKYDLKLAVDSYEITDQQPD